MDIKYKFYIIMYVDYAPEDYCGEYLIEMIYKCAFNLEDAKKVRLECVNEHCESWNYSFIYGVNDKGELEEVDY